MRVYLPTLSGSPTSGKSFFCHRLAKCFLENGIEVVKGENDKCDISLGNTKIENTKAKIKIVRLDGVWHDTGKPWKKRNEGLAKNMNSADAIVYQSNYAKRFCDKFLGNCKKPNKVIYNGADPNFYSSISTPKDFRNLSKLVFLAFSKWRPHKRLRDIIESFLLANIKDSFLVIVGDLQSCGLSDSEKKRFFGIPNIKYMGILKEKEVASYLRIARGSVHICWFDACPNSVVEAIVAGVPVISNNISGAAELVGLTNGGYICDIDEEYNMEPIDVYHPPAINHGIVANAMRKCVIEKLKINSDSLNIYNIANQYLSFFRELL